MISLFNAAIPLIAIQMRAHDVGGVLTLTATTVLSQVHRGTDEEGEAGQATDRTYWINRGSQSSVALADTILGLVNDVTPGMSLKYNRHYIGLAWDGIADNFVQVGPRREHAIVEFRIPRDDTVSEVLGASGLDVLAYNTRWGRYRIRLTEADLPANRRLLVDLIRRAAGTPAPVDE
ncbi:hypothetical protein [Micromonospora kangleipakensis]|uniref:hypothetical protein n=1 Tax=Micromonospora kangleipakensis TaxID=1077942 RepID=UPI001A9257A9|nr:hypothetical protein [Micromonospora kangleipakensis]